MFEYIEEKIDALLNGVQEIKDKKNDEENPHDIFFQKLNELNKKINILRKENVLIKQFLITEIILQLKDMKENAVLAQQAEEIEKSRQRLIDIIINKINNRIKIVNDIKKNNELNNERIKNFQPPIETPVNTDKISIDEYKTFLQQIKEI